MSETYQYYRDTRKVQIEFFNPLDDQVITDVPSQAPVVNQRRPILFSTLNMPFTLGIAAGTIMSFIEETNFIPTYTASLSSTALTCQLISGGIAAIAFLKYSRWPGRHLTRAGINMACAASTMYVMRSLIDSPSIATIPMLYAISNSVVDAFDCSEPKSIQKIITSTALIISSTASFLYCSSIPHATSWIIPKTILTMMACNLSVWPSHFLLDKCFAPLLE